jgi:phospholipid-binding lipoprotein MlaA
LVAALSALTLAAAPRAVRAAEAPAAAPPGPPAADAGIEDPFEKMNRRFFANNQKTDRLIIRPLVMGYQHALPRFLRDALHNLVTEIGEPMVFANDVVQLRFARAGRTAARFVANATIGMGGLRDPATEMGLPHHSNGFGDTMGRYGITPGPYLYLPLFGPSNFRDIIGMAVDFMVDPVGWGHYDGDAAVRGGIWTVSGLDQRMRAEPDLQAIADSADPYARMRSFYMQNRQSEIQGGRQIKIEELPQFDDEPAPAPTPSSPPASAPSAAASAKPTSAVMVLSPSGASGDAAAFLTPAPGPAAAAGAAIEL